MRTYEMVLVYDPRVADDEVLSLTGEVRNLLTSKGGVTVTKTDVWGRRRLAYEIADVNEGKYVVVYFAAEDGQAPIAEVERRLQQNDRVLRFLTTRTDEGLKRAGLPIPTEPESEEAVAGISPAASDDSAESGSEPDERPSRPHRKPAADEPKPAKEAEKAEKAEKAEEPKPAKEAEKAEPAEEPRPTEEAEKAEEPAEAPAEPEATDKAEEPAASEEAAKAEVAGEPEASEEPEKAGEAEASAPADEKKEEA